MDHLLDVIIILFPFTICRGKKKSPNLNHYYDKAKVFFRLDKHKILLILQLPHVCDGYD